MDTVGAIEINVDFSKQVELYAYFQDSGCIACSSSGGIILKHPGRVGHSPIWGAGVWAENRK